MQNKFYLPLLLGTALLFTGCSKHSEQQTNTNQATEKPTQTIEQKPKIAPEDDQKLTGTPVLGFKLRDSTFDSVKSRLNNYQLDDNYVSYADGPILENDGSGFEIAGLEKTVFHFNKDNKLVYVAMVLKESDPMSHETYKKIVNYIKKNGYKVTQVKAPFVGDQATYFATGKQEQISVQAPHMGGFKVYVEYSTDEYTQQKQAYLKQQQQQKEDAESANF